MTPPRQILLVLRRIIHGYISGSFKISDDCESHANTQESMAETLGAVKGLIALNGDDDSLAIVAETQSKGVSVKTALGTLGRFAMDEEMSTSGSDATSKMEISHHARYNTTAVVSNAINECILSIHGTSSKISCRIGSTVFANIFLKMNLNVPARGIGGDGHMRIFSCELRNGQPGAL